MKLKMNNKGVSLPLVVGLVMILMLASVAVNELIIRTLRSASQIEASDRAYFVAEAGIEDGLYELSEHYAGYETPLRKDDFGGVVKWDNDWQIKSRSNSTAFGTSTNSNLVLLPNQKLILGLYNDTSNPLVDKNGINPSPSDIELLSGISGNFSITFRIPYDRPGGYSSFLQDGLDINNDKDFETNEDGPGDFGICDTYEGEDADCDGKENEDSDQDPVILWKITDDNGNSLVPVRGCLTGTAIDDPYDPIGTEICEKDFQLFDAFIQATINYNTDGIDQDGAPKTIGEFISERDLNSKVQLELLIVAPLIDYSDTGAANVSLPYLEYEISSSVTTLPLPYFTIESDGWYRDFKQTIVTTLTPKTAVPLFDFTIIQQQ